ncbi:DUF6660 family protein [Christiangramia sp. SM2212]|uniref:Uncharacterized protein n=1 Tax=Christiangramia sediminicola TaxID=3073267 RepID=A0ABU1EQL0_9FLAO|nr:DUF6660 family protein [Christiangramia sp. SM2212]MDR5590488.1 hypothetical protein [Christiangramia sp. SM2212]
MKFLAVIFSVYFLGLSFMPCEDDVTTLEDATEFHQVDNTQSSGAAADDCSPFCQCHCCHIHITTIESEEADFLVPEISTKISSFRYDIGDDIPHSLFQPPRI